MENVRLCGEFSVRKVQPQSFSLHFRLGNCANLLTADNVRSKIYSFALNAFVSRNIFVITSYNRYTLDYCNYRLKPN